MKPKEILSYYGRIYPNAWKWVDKMREDRGKNLPFWPEWCFFPMSGAYAIVWDEANRQGLAGDKIDLNMSTIIDDVGVVCALATWRVTQGIYRFDPDVYESVVETELAGALPHDIFFQLPEWCVYVETPGLIYQGAELSGFFAHLEFDVNTYEKELRLVFHYRDDISKIPLLKPFPLHLGEWDLLTSIKKTFDQGFANMAETMPEEIPEKEVADAAAEMMEKELTAMVSLLLYLCSANGEIGNGEESPDKPRPKKTKKGMRLFPPVDSKDWTVGERMGTTIRRASRSYSDSVEHGEAYRQGPRPHVRRAHWHGYWVGPRDGERKFVLKWLPPIFVGESDIKVVTTRPVK